jgi:hypothetical protein
VQSTAARNALTPNVDDQVFNKETGRIERCVSVGPPSAWVVDEERLTGTINVRKYQDASWSDANGVATVGVGQAYLITPADISAHPEAATTTRASTRAITSAFRKPCWRHTAPHGEWAVLLGWRHRQDSGVAA